MRTGNPQSRLMLVRGPSGSGKSTVAAALRAEMGSGTALIEQDYVRRHLLKEKDTPRALTIGLLDVMVRRCLDGGFDVVLEGILDAGRYGSMLRSLMADHAGATVCAYLDVSFEETVRRHATRAKAASFSTDDMARWWVPHDVLGVDGEVVIGSESSVQETSAHLLALVSDQNVLGESVGSAT